MIVDQNDRAYTDGYMDALQPVLGIRIEEFAPLASAGPGHLFLINDGTVEIDTGIGGHDLLSGRSERTHVLGPRQALVLDLRR